MRFFMEKNEVQSVVRQISQGFLVETKPPFYIYAYERGFDVPYRFRFDCLQKKAMKRLVRGLKARGFSVNIWRPKNGQETKKTA